MYGRADDLDEDIIMESPVKRPSKSRHTPATRIALLFTMTSTSACKIYNPDKAVYSNRAYFAVPPEASWIAGDEALLWCLRTVKAAAAAAQCELHSRPKMR